MISLIIPAGGCGSRFSGSIKKQFYMYKGKPIIYYTLKAISTACKFSECIIGSPKDDHDFIRQIAFEVGINNLKLTEAGSERYLTVLNSLYCSDSDYVLIHDAVRPFVSKEVVTRTIKLAKDSGAAICGLPVRDTLKKINSDHITGTVDRKNIFQAHTPQVFLKKKLLSALEYCKDNNKHVTDDASAVEIIGEVVSICSSSYENIKITYENDIEFIDLLYSKYFG